MPFYASMISNGTNHCLLFFQSSDNNLGAEFQTEIQTMTSIKHLNLVRFFGYLEYQDEKILVIEFVPNGTLREHLDCKRNFPSMVVSFVIMLSFCSTFKLKRSVSQFSMRQIFGHDDFK